MDGKKVFIVVLILLAVLFGVGVILVAARPDPSSNDPERDPGSFETAMGGLFGSMKPKARLAAKEFACGTSTSVGGSDQAMRMVKFKLGDKCQVEIVYDRGPHLPKDNSDLDRQPWPDEDTRDRTSTSFVILKEGGTIKFGPCKNKAHSACEVFVAED